MRPDLEAELRGHLLRDVMPFWLRHAIDEVNGGIFTCIADDGGILSRDKYLWSQTRALWTFSALCRRIEDRREWREIADGLFDFLRRHGRDHRGSWIFRTDAEGNLIEGEKSIVTDAFAMMGLTEYFLLTGDQQALDMALETYGSVCARLARPGTYPTAPYPTPPGLRPHREYMQFSLAFTELGRAAANHAVEQHGLQLGRAVLDHFWRPEIPALLEYIGGENEFVDTPEGRTMVPGHGIESGYFQLLNFRASGEEALLRRSCDAIRCCCERGWDPIHGGLFLGLDVAGREPVYWKNAEMKLWWPHAEALPACLLAWEVCGEQWCVEWLQKIHEWSFGHFPVREFGEWTQRLDRAGRPVDTLVALPVKDPFHLPRALIIAIETLERIRTKPG